jgi:hypothetical protein
MEDVVTGMRRMLVEGQRVDVEGLLGLEVEI